MCAIWVLLYKKEANEWYETGCMLLSHAHYLNCPPLKTNKNHQSNQLDGGSYGWESETRGRDKWSRWEGSLLCSSSWQMWGVLHRMPHHGSISLLDHSTGLFYYLSMRLHQLLFWSLQFQLHCKVSNFWLSLMIAKVGTNGRALNSQEHYCVGRGIQLLIWPNTEPVCKFGLSKPCICILLRICYLADEPVFGWSKMGYWF